MPQINLASEIFRSRLVAQRRRLLYLFAAVVLLVILLSWALLLFLKSRVEAQIAEVTRETRSVEVQLHARQAEVHSIKLFAQRLALLQSRLAERTGWSPVLAELERTATPLSTFKKLSGSAETGTVTAEVVVPNLDAAADLLASLQHVIGANETFFTAVEMTDISSAQEASASPAGYVVSLRLTVPSENFLLSKVP